MIKIIIPNPCYLALFVSSLCCLFAIIQGYLLTRRDTKQSENDFTV